MIAGDFVRATELLVLRFQAVEMAHNDGHWNLAKHVVPLAEHDISSTTRAMRAALLQGEKRENKARALAEAAKKGS